MTSLAATLRAESNQLSQKGKALEKSVADGADEVVTKAAEIAENIECYPGDRAVRGIRVQKAQFHLF